MWLRSRINLNLKLVLVVNKYVYSRTFKTALFGIGSSNSLFKVNETLAFGNPELLSIVYLSPSIFTSMIGRRASTFFADSSGMP